MSDTNAPAELPPLPNYAVAPKTITVNGQSVGHLAITWGNGSTARSLEVKPPDLGDQFDLAEITGAQMGNELWRNMAMVAASVRAIDGVPLPNGSPTKEALRDTLRRIGLDGMRAASMALGNDAAARAAGTTVDAAKNS